MITRSRFTTVLSVLLALAVTLAGPLSARAAAPLPNSMAALGDSITRAYNTGSSSFTDAPANNWSTGTNASVNSLYLRIDALNPNPVINNGNYAVSGAKMAALNGQAANIPLGTEYVTILMGGNDVCTSSESTMTSVATFRSQFQTAMNSLAARLPNARVYVVSIPSVYNLWAVLKNNGSARFTWWLFRICQSMLKNPSSTSSTDTARRARVQQRNVDFNTQLAEVCATYVNCRFDGNAVYSTAFTASDISTRDYFHPSLAGQTKLAGVAWTASGLAP